MTSSNGNRFRVTGRLWEKSTGHRWIPLTKASEAKLWCFVWSVPEQTFEQTIETAVIWDVIITSLINSLRPSNVYTCVCKIIVIGSDNSLSPGRRQVVIWTNAGILIIGSLGIHFNEILSKSYTFSFKKTPVKLSSAKMASISSRPRLVNTPRVKSISRIPKPYFCTSYDFTTLNGCRLFKFNIKKF